MPKPGWISKNAAPRRAGNAARGTTFSPRPVASAGWELVRCARAALLAESDQLRRAARAIADGADAYRTNDLRLATTLDPR